MTPLKERIAIIDLGTNTFHLLIAERTGAERPVILHREKQPVKIGMGGINRSIITPEAIERALTCLRSFRKTMNDWNVTQTRAIGTSALRSAGNGEAVAHLIRTETGIDVRLISGDQEAEYIYFGVRSAVDLGKDKSLIIDIGGGSVEFIIANQDHLVWKHSFDVGAQRLLEKYQQNDPITPAEIASLNDFLRVSLEPLFQQMRIHQPYVMVGSSGTFDTLSEIYCVRNHMPYAETPETPLTLQAFDEIYAELICKNRAERLKIPGMIEMRVDMIVVACCLIKFLLSQFPFHQVRVSTYSLKEGVLTSLK